MRRTDKATLHPPPFERLVDEHGLMVRRVCRAVLSPADADDAWSETFLAALRAYPDLTDTRNLAGWLATIAHRKALDQIRSTGRRAAPVGEWGTEPLTEDRLRFIDSAELRPLLGQLTERQRETVIYRFIADMAYADIAELTNTTSAAVRRSVADALAALRQTHTKERSRT